MAKASTRSRHPWPPAASLARSESGQRTLLTDEPWSASCKSAGRSRRQTKIRKHRRFSGSKGQTRRDKLTRAGDSGRCWKESGQRPATTSSQTRHRRRIAAPSQTRRVSAGGGDGRGASQAPRMHRRRLNQKRADHTPKQTQAGPGRRRPRRFALAGVAPAVAPVLQ